MEQVDVAQEIEHEGVGRVLVDLIGSAGLLDFALVHDHDPVGHLQRLLLIVGDEDAGDVDFVVQPVAASGAVLRAPGRPGRRTARPAAAPGVRPPGHGPGRSAGAARRRAVPGNARPVPSNCTSSEQFVDLVPDLRLGGACLPGTDIQAEGNVFKYGHVLETGRSAGKQTRPCAHGHGSGLCPRR